MSTIIENRKPVTVKERPEKAQGKPESLVHALAGCRNRSDLFQTALPLIAEQLDAPLINLQVESRSGTLALSHSPAGPPAASLVKLCQGMLLKAQVQVVSQARSIKLSGSDRRFALLTVPIAINGEGTVGAMVVMTPCDRSEFAQSRLAELQSLASLLGVMASQASSSSKPKSSQQPAELSGIAKAARYQTVDEFVFEIVNGLKSKLDCEQVYLGRVRGNHVKLLCMSGFDNLYPRSPGSRQIEQSMEECLDAGEIVFYQPDTSESHDGNRFHLHAAWSKMVGQAAVASIPLMQGDQCIAVLSIRNSERKKTDFEQLERVSQMVTPLIPGLPLLEKANQGWIKHSGQSLGKLFRSTLGSRSLLRQAAMIGLVSLGCWIGFGETDYIVSVPCQVEPQQVQQISAPYEATIASVHVQPGDRVQPGDLILRLDTSALEVERRSLGAEAKITELELTRATSEKDLEAAAQARLQKEMIQNQLTLIDRQIKQAEIRASEPGVILQGDLTQRIGQTIQLGEPLIQVARGGNWVTRLHVPQHATAYIETGDGGEMTFNARPDCSTSIRIQRVHANANQVNGQNVFLAEAIVEGETPDWMLSGMEGISRINTGRKKVWWVLLHRPIESAKLALWKF